MKVFGQKKLDILGLRYVKLQTYHIVYNTIEMSLFIYYKFYSKIIKKDATKFISYDVMFCNAVPSLEQLFLLSRLFLIIFS